MVYRGRVKGGVVVLEKPGDLPEGAAVTVSLETSPTSGTTAVPSLLERLGDVAGKAEGLPPDMSINHDHYLYGSAKQKP